MNSIEKLLKKCFPCHEYEYRPDLGNIVNVKFRKDSPFFDVWKVLFKNGAYTLKLVCTAWEQEAWEREEEEREEARNRSAWGSESGYIDDPDFHL